jgi:hypothetical protein
MASLKFKVTLEQECSAVQWAEENALTPWQTDATCVRSLQTLKIMPWHYRALSLSLILAPFAVTVAGCFHTGNNDLSAFWPWLIIFFWLGFGLDLSIYIRGYLAQSRGVSPARPGKRPSLGVEIGYLMLLMIVVGLMANIALGGLHPFQRGAHDWSLLLIMIALLFQQLSNYARTRFWDADLNDHAAFPHVSQP